MRLSDGIAVVTGAGGGLGRALAVELSARGQQVVALGRAPEGISETAAMDPSGRITSVTADVTDAQALRAAFVQITRTAPVTLLVNNAAIYPRRDFLDETPESFAETLAINLGGTVACTRLAMRCPRGQGASLRARSWPTLPTAFRALS